MNTSDFERRMRDYEDANKDRLIKKLPVCIRVDSVAFHTFTKGMVRPFDPIIQSAMRGTMINMCMNIPGCVIGYTQSDEITLILADYFNKNTEAWYGYVRRKLESVTASMATKHFNLCYAHAVGETIRGGKSPQEMMTYLVKSGSAMFDSRAFNLPPHEVVNELIWRQEDCIRNSIQAVGHANFSNKELHGKNCKQIKKMLENEKQIKWDEIPVDLQRGVCCIKKPTVFNEGTEKEFWRDKWVLDENIPKFTENRNYIEDRVLP